MANLKDLSVSFLSLVARPATGKGLTLKSDNPAERFTTFDLVVKNDEMMRAYGIVYSPGQVDAHGDSADADTIRRAQAEFMREGRLKNIDVEHSFNAEQAYVAESWLVRKGDPLFPGEPEGSWAAGIQIGDPDIWRQLKAGDLTGISLAGVARMEPQPDDPPIPHYTEKSAPGWFRAWLKALTSADRTTTTEETEMDDKAIQGLVRDTLKAELPGAIAEALKAAGSAPLQTPPATPPVQAEETGLEKAIAKGFDALEAKIDAKIAKATAKGVVETGPLGAASESFA